MERLIQIRLIIFFISTLIVCQPVLGTKNSGSIWITQFLPGSAKLSDPTLDRSALAFVDSLMQRDDIEVTFLGGADPTNWRLFGKSVKYQVSDTWDQAKKLERASALRQRYNRGQIGTTDEPFRGVKVVWGPRKPDIFKLQDQLGRAEGRIDSLTAALDSLKNVRYFTHTSIPLEAESRPAEKGMLFHSTYEPSIVSDWEMTSGVMVWSAGEPYDLSVPYVGLAFKRRNWALEFQGGFTPWSQHHTDGKRGNALLFGSLHVFPEPWLRLKIGLFSGWEFLSDSDVWTMKVQGLSVGPKIRWKIFETYLGYTIGKMSSLTKESWCSGGLITTSLHLKVW